jgi:hypothetical protein
VCERAVDGVRELALDRALDRVHHLLRLVLARLVRDRADLVPEQPQLVLPRPRGRAGLDDGLLGAGLKRALGGRARAADDVREAVLAHEPVAHGDLELCEARLVQVLELAEEERRECRVRVPEQVRALALVHALVVPRRVAVVALCAPVV